MEKLQIRGVNEDNAMWFRLMAKASGKTMGELFNAMTDDYIERQMNDNKFKAFFHKEEK